MRTLLTASYICTTFSVIGPICKHLFLIYLKAEDLTTTKPLTYHKIPRLYQLQPILDFHVLPSIFAYFPHSVFGQVDFSTTRSPVHLPQHIGQTFHQYCFISHCCYVFQQSCPKLFVWVLQPLSPFVNIFRSFPCVSDSDS